MKISQQRRGLERGLVKRELRWDLFGLMLGVVIVVILVFILDTGSVAEWIAKHKESRIDESIAVGVLLLIGLAVYSTGRWLRLSKRLIDYEDSDTPERLPDAARIESSQRRDLVGLFVVMVIAVAFVFMFDTGSLAEWIAKHKETKIDEAIVAGIILLIGMSFFSIRRRIELTDQVKKYEELYIQTVKLSRESALLGEFSELLQSCLSVEEAHQLIASRAQMLLPGISGALCITASSRDIVEVVATWGHPALPETFFAPKDCWALRRGRFHILGDDPGVVSCAHIGKVRPRGAICMPMMAHGEALGLLYLDTGPVEALSDGRDETVSGKLIQEFSGEFSDSDVQLARTFGEQSALALANLNMRETLKAQSIRDPLTGLYNRRYMEESLERELSRAVRKKSGLGIMMLDVDHFKQFNDTFGHEAGDAVLRQLGNLLSTQFRGEDVVCRYGGEEFTVILPEANAEAILRRAEHLCEEAKKGVAEFHDQTPKSISLSIGVSNFPTDGATAETLLRAADAALYRAKKQGRDRVVVA
jgi:diguanylate cyclase (GGDEF)-like protein